MPAPLRSLALAAALLATPAVADDDVILVVDRTPLAIEVYFAMRADEMLALFDLPPERLASPDGTVDFEGLRLGTYDLGDEMFAKVSADVDGQPLLFEAMSLMVHPEESALPLVTPFDGLVAIGVCTVPSPEVPLGLDDLRAYAGYIAYTDTPDGPFTLTLPETGRAPLEILVRDHARGEPGAVYRTSLADGAPLALGAPEPRRDDWLLIALISVASAMGAAAIVSLRVWTRGRAGKAAVNS
ncbi:MAG: hypothetical protein AAGG09_09820 [Pseudomonadota bacterium]